MSPRAEKPPEPRVALGAATPAKDVHEPQDNAERVQRSIPVLVDGAKVATVQLLVDVPEDGALPVVSYGVTDHRA